MGLYTVIIDSSGRKTIWKNGEEYPYRFYHAWIDDIYSWWSSREWRSKQALFAKTGTRYYGDGGTIHSSGQLDVEIHDGKVIAVWFRCQPLPFRQSNASIHRAKEMKSMYKDFNTTLHGVEVSSDNKAKVKNA